MRTRKLQHDAPGWLCLLVVSMFVLHGPALIADDGQTALLTLKTFCHRCHGIEQQISDFDVLNYESLTKPRADGDASYRFVVPGDLDASTLWEHIEGDDAYMPLEGSDEADKITAADRNTIRQWILEGAKFPARIERMFVTQNAELKSVRSYLIAAPPEDRRHLRFFSLSNLSNNPSYSELDLKLARAAISKLMNSLSWEKEIVLPDVLPNSQNSVLAIDLRKIGWSSREWLRIINHNPYGLNRQHVADPLTSKLAIDIAELAGVQSPIVRADWFAFAASRAPLYHDLLKLPTELSDLENQLGVERIRNIQTNKAIRAGFGRSGVSRQNRLVERHEGTHGAYWISYDFLPRKGRGDLIRFPLGPGFEGNEFNRHAFNHDGGEVIFHLPNGLQGYYLMTAEGQRIDGPAPADVVFDSAAAAGSPAIINGISCMNCHREGMIHGFRDEIRNSGALAGRALEKVQALYRPAQELEQWIAQDRTHFLRSLHQAIGPFLDLETTGDNVTQFADPVASLVRRYQADLGPNEIAIELGFPSINSIRSQIENNRDLRKLGLGTLIQASPGTIKRARWEAIDGTSFYQDVAVELRLGIPVLPGSTFFAPTASLQQNR